MSWKIYLIILAAMLSIFTEGKKSQNRRPGFGYQKQRFSGRSNNKEVQSVDSSIPCDLPKALIMIGALKERLSQYVGVTAAVFAKGILEEILKKYLQPYVSVPTAAGIEAAYIQFLNDTTNQDSVRLNKMILNRMTRKELARNVRTAYATLSKIIHAASAAYRSLHGTQMFLSVLLGLPRLTDSEKMCVEILTEFL